MTLRFEHNLKIANIKNMDILLHIQQTLNPLQACVSISDILQFLSPTYPYFKPYSYKPQINLCEN